MSEKWDENFMGLAAHIAAWSKDPSTKVGAVIVDSRRVVIGMGYNGFPRGVEDSEARLNHRPSKYALVVHAETNAILNSTRELIGTTMYCTLFPCGECAKLIVQAGIAEVICPKPTAEQISRWGSQFASSKILITEGGVKSRYHYARDGVQG